MKCEISGKVCERSGNCADCVIAADAIMESVENIRRNYHIEPINIDKDSYNRNITATWAQNPLARVNKGKLEIEEFDL